MIAAPPKPATFDDLMRTEGKAELINGRIVKFMPSGDLPTTVGFEIAVALRAFVKATHLGRAYPDNIGYALPYSLKSGRQSFSPDASLFDGPPASNRMRFLTGAPTFAVEVRSENDFGRTPDREYDAKREDYFEAGTLVVWDVDPIAKTITKHTPTDTTTFGLGDIADAEPAVPGWTLDVSALFADAA